MNGAEQDEIFFNTLRLVILQIEMNEKYRNQTCGLCGDFNEVQTYNEFVINGKNKSDQTIEI